MEMSYFPKSLTTDEILKIKTTAVRVHQIILLATVVFPMGHGSIYFECSNSDNIKVAASLSVLACRISAASSSTK